MGQITIYLDDESERSLRSAAESAGIPVSRWVANLIREKTSTQWPDSVREMAGAWSDFPDPETLRARGSDDTGREEL